MKTTFLLTLIVFLISCNHNEELLTRKQAVNVEDSVRQMTASIAKNVSGEGPIAWLQYFKDTPDFFMASEGQLVFPNSDSAKNFIQHTLVKSIRKIELHWSDIRIDPLTNKLASVAAAFRENITDSTGKIWPQNGYFTGIAQQTPQGWKLRNAHWSIIPH